MNPVLQSLPNKNDHYQGSLYAPVSIVVYGDFECPYSGALAPVIEQLISEYRDDICFIYRHFPLKGIHPSSETAAIASEAAAEQDQFWSMYHLLFDNQEHLSKSFIEMLARKLGLDMIRFKQDMNRYDLMEKVNVSHLGGKQSGVESTPSIFINNKAYEGSSSYWPLREEIESYLHGKESLHS